MSPNGKLFPGLVDHVFFKYIPFSKSIYLFPNMNGNGEFPAPPLAEAAPTGIEYLNLTSPVAEPSDSTTLILSSVEVSASIAVELLYIVTVVALLLSIVKD